MSAITREKKPWPAYVASFIINDMTGACKKRGLTVANCGVKPSDLGLLLSWNYDEFIDRKTARQCLEHMLDRAAEARVNVKEFMDWAAEYSREKLSVHC